MKVAVYHSNSDIRIEEVPIPSIKKGEILLKVHSSGICGTDVMEWYRKLKGPRVLGHEIAGEVIASQAPNFSIGGRVFVTHHVPCFQCEYCAREEYTACEHLHKGNIDPGGFSQFIRVPEMNVRHGTYNLPTNMSYDEAAMIEPLACAIRAVDEIHVQKEDSVLVLGAGMSGLLIIQMALLAGATVTATDINEFRLQMAGKLGAHACNAHDVQIKAHKIILCTGSPSAVHQAFQAIHRRGHILLYAIPKENIQLPNTEFWRNELRLSSIYGAAPKDLKKAMNLIAEKKVDVTSMITHHLPLEKIQNGFQLVAKAEESLKVIIHPHT